MKKLKSALLVLMLGISMLTPQITNAQNTQKFSDVSEIHPNFKAIEYLKDRYIINGYEDGSFHPENQVNRAEALKIIILSANYHLDKENLATLQNLKKISTSNATDNNSTTPEIEPMQFKDVNSDHWFFPYVKKATELNIISGYPDGNFKPENTINLAESLKMILLANQAPLPKTQGNPYKDIEENTWYARYFEYYKNYKLLTPDSKGNITPDKLITRGELSELIYRYIKREEFKELTSPELNDYIFGKATYYGEGDSFDGKNTASGEVFDKNKLTAAHKTLPFGTKIRVTGIENDKTVEVTINDRGPYDYRFILDLSAAAFEKLAPISRGFIDIKFEIIN